MSAESQNEEAMETEEVYEVRKSDIYRFLASKIYLAHRMYSRYNDIIVLADSLSDAEAKARQFFGISEDSRERIIIRQARETERPDVLIFH